MNIQVIIKFFSYVQCYTYVFVMFISTYINLSMFITIYADDTLDQNILDDVLISSGSRITYIKLHWGSKTIIANIYLATAIGDWSPSSVLDLLEWLLTITLAYS